MTIPRLGNLIVFPDKSIGYVYETSSIKIDNINWISVECRLVPDTEYLKKTWLKFYMPACNMESDFHNGFQAEHDKFAISKFGNKVFINSTHKKFNECCRLSGWEIVGAPTHHKKDQSP